MRRHIAAVCCLAGLAGLGLAWFAPTGLAAERRLLTTREMGACLCLMRLLEGQKEDVELRRAIYEDRQAALRDLELARRERTNGIDESDPAQVEALRRLLAQRRSLAGRLRQDTLPDYQDAVLGYNQTAERYNALCGDASYRERTVEEARQALDCPAY
ncbi:MAG: hypothetical protein ACE5JZ_08030 [Kiloniellales bacterium]